MLKLRDSQPKKGLGGGYKPISCRFGGFCGLGSGRFSVHLRSAVHAGSGWRFGFGGRVRPGRRDAVLMAIPAFNPVDIVGAGGVDVGCVHLLHIDAAVGHLRMACLAGGPRVLVVASVASEAAYAFVHADGGAVVPRTNLWTPRAGGGNGSRLRRARRMALVAECLTRVLTDGYQAGVIMELRNRKRGGFKVEGLAAVVEGQRGGHSHARRGYTRGWPGLLRAFAVDLVAGDAGDGRLTGEARGNDAPRAAGVEGLDQFANGPVEIHAMATKAVLHKHLPGVLRTIGEYLRVCRTVRPRMPAGVLLLVASAAARSHLLYIQLAQADVLRNRAEEMDANVAQLGGQGSVMAILAAFGTVGRGVDDLDMGSHFMAACTAIAELRRVVIRRAEGDGSSQHGRRGDSNACESEEWAHERSPVPFQLRSRAAEAK